MKERIIRKKKEKHSSLLIFSISEILLTAPEQIQNIHTKNALIADYLCGSPCHLDIHLNNKLYFRALFILTWLEKCKFYKHCLPYSQQAKCRTAIHLLSKNQPFSLKIWKQLSWDSEDCFDNYDEIFEDELSIIGLMMLDLIIYTNMGLDPLTMMDWYRMDNDNSLYLNGCRSSRQRHAYCN